MFELEPGEEERMIRDTARRFAETELRDRLREHERMRDVTTSVRQRYEATGLDVLDWPESAGGQGLGALARSLVLEELAAVDPGAAVALGGAGIAGLALAEGAPQRLDACRGRRGAVIEDLEGRFRAGDHTLSGEHPWVPADAPEFLVVFQGERVFLVGAGVVADPVVACGLEAAGAARLRLDGARVEEILDEPRVVDRARARIRTALAALLVGAARGAQHYAMAYAVERTAFGRPIAHHQAVAFLIADMAMAVEAARAAVWRAAVALDAGEAAIWESASGFAEAAEQALFVAPNAVQLLGGHGFMKDHPVEKWMRDVRTLAQLFGGRDAAELDAARAVGDRGLELR